MMQILHHLDEHEPFEPIRGVQCKFSHSNYNISLKFLFLFSISFKSVKNSVFINMAYPVATSHIFMVLSRDADKTKSPAGKNATEDTL